MNLYNKHRPNSLDDVYGNFETVEYLKTAFKNKDIPQAILLFGDTGCGKTTLARIVANKLKVGEYDLSEINSSDFRGIDTVRGINKAVKLHPMMGKCKMWIIDECHKMTNDAQNAMLKVLEEPIKNNYFILCTTEPNRLLDTIKGRCVQLKVEPLDDVQCVKLLKDISKNEKIKIKGRHLELIAQESLNRPRNAINILEKVKLLPEEQRKGAIGAIAEKESTAINIARNLLKPKGTWKNMTLIIKDIKKETTDPEGIRRMILSYCETVLLNGQNDRAAMIIEEFYEPLYNQGWPGFVFNCYSIFTNK